MGVAGKDGRYAIDIGLQNVAIVVYGNRHFDSSTSVCRPLLLFHSKFRLSLSGFCIAESLRNFD